MQALTQSAPEWAEKVFGEVELGDARLTARTVQVAGGLAAAAGGTLPAVFPEWGQLHAAYRLLHNPKVGFQSLSRPFWGQTRAVCSARGTYLLLEDTTQLDFTGHPATSGLGHIGDGQERGFLLHSCLAVRVERYEPETGPALNLQGLFGQELWRRLEPPRGERQDKRKRQKRVRESARWGSFLAETNGPPPGTQWVYVADRESDILEAVERCRARAADFVIRAAWDRRLSGEVERLMAAAAQAPARGGFTLSLRARPGQPARVAELTVRSRKVEVQGPKRPGGRLANQEMWVVEVRENRPPAGVKPLHWVLLTSLPAETLAQCRRVVSYYEARWLTEEYHKALKTGTGVEESQLAEARALENLIAVLSIVAARLLALKLLARAAPARVVETEYWGPEVWAVLTSRYGRPAGGWTAQAGLVAVARLGGFLARRGDGMPGWLTIWRGWQRLVLLVEGYSLAQKQQRCG
jgi:hypothetical protein